MDANTRQIYADLERLLFKGFIQQRAKIGDLNFVFKSVSLKEVEQVEALSGFSDDPDYELRFSRIYSGYSIYILDDENVLDGNRAQFVRNWSKEFVNLPDVYLKAILARIQELNLRVKTAFKLIEPYSYEDLSRYYWRAYDGKNLNSFEITGVPGTDNLSLSEHQIYWMVLNRTEDNNVKYENDWGFAKFIASAHNPKGVKKIEDRDKQRKKHESERRERIKQRLRAGPAEDVVKVEAWTAQELQKQLVDWVEGRKDLHDEMMEEFENQQKELWEQRQAEVNEQMRRRQEEYERENEEEPLKLIPVNKAHIQRRMNERMRARAQSLGRLPNADMLDDNNKPKIFQYHESESQPEIQKPTTPPAPSSSDVSPSYQPPPTATDPRVARREELSARRPPVPQRAQVQEPAPPPPTRTQELRPEVDASSAVNPRMAQYLGVQEMKKKAEETLQKDERHEMRVTESPAPSRFVPAQEVLNPVSKSREGTSTLNVKRVHGGGGLVYTEETAAPIDVPSLDPNARRNEKLGVTAKTPTEEAALRSKGDIDGSQNLNPDEVERIMRSKGLKK